MKEGETFESDTDTEVIPKLCKFLYRLGPHRGSCDGPAPAPALHLHVWRQRLGLLCHAKRAPFCIRPRRLLRHPP